MGCGGYFVSEFETVVMSGCVIVFVCGFESLILLLILGRQEKTLNNPISSTC